MIKKKQQSTTSNELKCEPHEDKRVKPNLYLSSILKIMTREGNTLCSRINCDGQDTPFVIRNNNEHYVSENGKQKRILYYGLGSFKDKAQAMSHCMSLFRFSKKKIVSKWFSEEKYGFFELYLNDEENLEQSNKLLTIAVSHLETENELLEALLSMEKICFKNEYCVEETL